MLVSSLSFALMGLCVKSAASSFSSGELVFYRGIVGIVVMGAWMRLQGVGLKSTVPWEHLWRTLAGVVSLCAWFYALATLPLATAMTLNYTSSLWVAAFVLFGAALWGGAAASKAHGLHTGLVFTVAAGFAGVVLLLRPAIHQGQLLEGLIGLASGFIAAFAYMQVSKLTRLGEPESRIVFYFAVGTVVVGAISLLFTGMSSLQTKAALWLFPIGVLASIGQICMTKAYGSGQTLLAANLQYLGIVYAALLGLWFFDDIITFSGWLGMTLIIASGVAATALRRRASPSTQEPAEEF
jgi:S-adenosylmethionine uptake transporter